METLDEWLAVAAADPEPATALLAAADWLEESGQEDDAIALRCEAEGGSVLKFPVPVGENVFICTVTLYYVGRVAEVGLGYVRLEEASWVHWTGRLSVLTKLHKFKGQGFGTRKPRTEHVGDVGIPTESIVSYYPGPWELPGTVE